MRHQYTLDIGQVIKQTGLAASTLRYYEEKGLIQSIGRRGLRRVFHGSVIQQLALISLGRSAGFTLDEISEMLTTSGTNIDKQKLLNKADDLEKKIKQLTTMRNGLIHAANCSAPSHLECPKFIRLLRMASQYKATTKNNFYNQ